MGPIFGNTNGLNAREIEALKSLGLGKVHKMNNAVARVANDNERDSAKKEEICVK